MKRRLRISVEGKTYDVDVELLDEDDGGAPAPRERAEAASSTAGAPESKPASSAKEGEIASPLGAIVVSVDVAVGDSVEAGRKVVTLEAMKMNTVVNAPEAGTVEAIHVKPGDGVEEGQALLSLAL